MCDLVLSGNHGSGHSYEVRLARRPSLATDAPSIADLSASAEVFLGAEAGVEPARWAAVSAWLARLRGLPGWIGQYALFAR